MLGIGCEAEPKTYEFQSGGVISMLEGLQDKFVDERITLEKEEQAKKHSYAAEFNGNVAPTR